MRIRNVAFGALAALVLAEPAGASPFGISQGTPISSLKIVRKLSPRSFEVSPTVKNRNFDLYEVFAAPPSGVCAISAYTPAGTPETASDNFRQIVRLYGVYGRNHTVKTGRRSDLLNLRPSDFPREWSEKLPHNLASIVVEIVKVNDQHRVEVNYTFRNIRRCNDWGLNLDRTGI